MTSLKRIPRLFMSQRLAMNSVVNLDRAQSRYVASVMRLKTGDRVRLFNGRDGEWLCTLGNESKAAVTAQCSEKLAEATSLPDIDYLFAPLKSARLDYLAQKATEMGVRRLRPVITERTVVRKVNLHRIEANVREAAEQCNMVCKPEVLGDRGLVEVLSQWDTNRRMIFCDEDAPAADPVAALRGIPPGPLAVLVGPEGGFSPAEQERLRSVPSVTAISLGPRVMRADTAAVAALALVQAVLGDWCADQPA